MIVELEVNAQAILALLACLLAIPIGSSAQSDLTLELSVSPEGATPPGTRLDLQFIVHNKGPGSIPGFIIVSGPIATILNEPTSLACDWASVSDPYSLLVASNQDLAAGESRTCSATGSVDSRAEGFPTVEWNLRASGNIDPDEIVIHAQRGNRCAVIVL